MKTKTIRPEITQSMINQITTFLHDAITKRGFKRAIFGLSGGVDSAVVARLCTLALKAENCLALLLPSRHSNPKNLQDALDFCTYFNLPYKLIKLESFELAYNQNLQDQATPLTYGNFCARMRMNVLYDQSQKNSSLVIGTSNKSELMLGYGTLFGDLACAINPIAPFYKTEIYKLAKLLEIPQSIIAKAPSADLYPNQSDEGDLGYSYEQIDKLLIRLEMLKEESIHLLEKEGFDPIMTQSILKRIKTNAFKRELPEFFSFTSLS